MLADEVPEQYYDVGIAEQHAVLFAAGLALEGMKPVAAIYSTFLQRGFDQIVHDVCLQKLDVTFCMDRAGLVGDDGPTHHGAYDISYLRGLPEHRPDGAARRGDARPHAAHGDRARRARRGPVPARGGGRACRCPTARRDPDRHRGDAGPGRARGAGRLRHRGADRARRGRDAARARHRPDRLRRPLREAARPRAAAFAGGLARAARDRRGERARGRLRLGGAGAPVRLRARSPAARR